MRTIKNDEYAVFSDLLIETSLCESLVFVDLLIFFKQAIKTAP